MKNLFDGGKAPVQAARKAFAKMRVTAGDELQETEIGGQGFCQVQPHAGSKVLEVLFGKSVLLKEDVRIRRREDLVKTKLVPLTNALLDWPQRLDRERQTTIVATSSFRTLPPAVYAVFSGKPVNKQEKTRAILLRRDLEH